MENKSFGSKLWDGYMSLHVVARSAIALGAAYGVFVLGQKGYHAIWPSDKEKQNKQLQKDIANEIKNAQAAGQVQSFEDSQYMTLANTCYEGMRYAVGDNYGAVEASLKKMKNNLDVALLIKAFGLRQNYFFGVPSGNPMDLFTFVQSELGNDYGGITGYRVASINADWASKGITYKI